MWAYNVKTYFNQLYCEQVDVGVYLTWVPLVGGTLGALFGGLVSDRLARFSGHRGRMWVLILSQVRLHLHQNKETQHTHTHTPNLLYTLILVAF